ncbi:hypothetical protein [Clavibacter sp. MX14-G9D]|uniref:hypothetical protein n=1 Tax=Clavibacter sp. MX14-G9D TaxID=3064656 RepID=UPI00293E3632|nr:hypothetical protein [Clavibacter sp. MX14-G9D]
MTRPARPAARGRRRAAIALGAAALAVASIAIATPANAKPESTFHETYWNGIDVYVSSTSSARGFGLFTPDWKYTQCAELHPGWNAISLPANVLAFHMSALPACNGSTAYDVPWKFGKAGQTWALVDNHAYVLRK